MEVKTKRVVQNLCCLRSFCDYCVAIIRTEELRGAVSLFQSNEIEIIQKEGGNAINFYK